MPSRTYLAPCGLALALAAAPLAACGSQAVAANEPSQPSASSTPDPQTEGEVEPIAASPRYVMHIALELDDLMNVREPGADQTRVSLITHDVSNGEQRHVLGVFAGICTEAQVGAAEAGLPAAAIAGADCRGGARAANVRLVHQGDQLVALRAWLDDEEDEAALPAYDELQRVSVGADTDVVIGRP
jgi:hypothetical protein